MHGWLTPSPPDSSYRASVRALLAVATVFAYGCARERVVRAFTLRVAVSGVLEPVRPDTELRSWSVIAQPWVFEPLARIGDRGEIVPVLAARVETLAPNRLRLWVRSDARFDDGSPVTFEDVRQSVGRNRLRATMAEGEAIVIESDELGLPPELLVARTPIFRRAGERMMGAGPFLVEEQDAQQITLRRREHLEGRIDRVVIQSYATQKEAFSHTLRGDADLLPEAESRWLEFFEGVTRLKVVRSPGAHVNVVAFNLERLSRHERISLAHVLASDEVRVQAFGDSCLPPPHKPRSEPLPSGRTLDVIAVPLFERFALAVRRTLGVRGGSVRLIELNSYFEAVKNSDFDLAAARPQISPPSMASLIWHTGATHNVLGYSNPKVDAALDARDWEAAQRALDEDPPAAFVCTRPYIMIVDSRIKNAFSSPMDLPNWEIAR